MALEPMGGRKHMGLIVAPDPAGKPPASWAREVAETVNSLYGLRPTVLVGRVSIKATTAVNNTNLGTYFTGFKAVKLPAGAFTGSPAIVLTGNSGYPGNMIQCSVSGVSAAGFTVNMARTDSTSTYIYWMAVTQTQEGS